MKESDIRNRETFNTYLLLVEKDAKTFFNPEEFIIINCPACNTAGSREQFKKAGFIYALCSGCNTLFVNPRPKPEKIKEFYRNSPSSIFWVEKFFKPVAEARRDMIFKPRAQYIAGLFPGLSGMRIADIGAGFGLFFEELRKILPSNTFIAIEPSEGMAEICKKKGITVEEEFLENIPESRNNSLDLITAFELFEHITEPGQFLAKIFELLKPGGYFLLTTLNGEGFDIQVLWEKSKSVMPPHHLNFFNPVSIRNILVKSGFEVIEVSTPGKLDWDIVEGMFRNENVSIGYLWETVAKRGDIAAKEELQRWISAHGFSSHMRVLARKKA